MRFSELINDKGLKAKEKAETIAAWLLKDPKKINEVLDHAAAANDVAKATCIEAIEFATKVKPEIANADCLKFLSGTLTEKAARVKWESARAISNIAHLFPTRLNDAIINLLNNTEHMGMVVRWSAALALGEIIKMKTKMNDDLIPAVEAICRHEHKPSITKIYRAALKEVEIGKISREKAKKIKTGKK